MKEIFPQLNRWMAQRSAEDVAEGLPRLRPCSIRVVGQIALILAEVPLTLAATKDVDCSTRCEPSVRKRFEGHEAWMPNETEFEPIFSGRFVTASFAQPDFVLLSKARMSPQKNRVLLTEYLAQGASDRFLRLARKYRVDLEGLL